MREFLIQAARVSEECDKAELVVQSFVDGDISTMEGLLGISTAYVECRRAMNMIAAQMAVWEHTARRMREATLDA